MKGEVKFNLNEATMRNVFKDLDLLIAKNSKGLRDAINRSAIIMESTAKSKCVVDTGQLRSSILPNYSDNRLRVSIGTDLLYAPFVEFGTGITVQVPSGLEDYAIKFKGAGLKEVNLPARPFLFPAFEQEAPQFIKAVEKLIEKL